MKECFSSPHWLGGAGRGAAVCGGLVGAAGGEAGGGGVLEPGLGHQASSRKRRGGRGGVVLRKGGTFEQLAKFKRTMM